MSIIPGYCEYDGCESPVEGRTPHCASHGSMLRRIQRDLNAPVKPVKSLRRAPVNKVSTKRAYENGRYTEARIKFLEINVLCVACGEKATEVHHKAGRENHLLMEKQYWISVCHGCHELITKDSAWAIREGYSISRNKS